MLTNNDLHRIIDILKQEDTDLILDKAAKKGTFNPKDPASSKDLLRYAFSPKEHRPKILEKIRQETEKMEEVISFI